MKVSRYQNYLKQQIIALKMRGFDAKSILRYKLELPNSDGSFSINWREEWLYSTKAFSADNAASRLSSSI